MSGQSQKMLEDLGHLLPELAVLATAIGGLVLEMVRRPRWAWAWSVFGLMVATALAAAQFTVRLSVFHETFRVDTLLVFARLVLIPSTALCSLLAIPELGGSRREATFHALLAFGLLGSLLLAGAGDAMFLVLGVLLTSLASFPLVAHHGDDRATEAAMKYFVFGSVSGAVMIFGLTFWYGATGSTLLSDLSRLRTFPAPEVIGLVAVLVGVGYKAALAPFHFWAPDAYDGGPLCAAAYLSVVPKIGALFALAQVARSLPTGPVDARLAFGVVAAASMTWGTLAALTQTNVVRLLAYSSIAQAGYFLMGVAALPASALAVRALVLFAAAFAVMNLGAFAGMARVGRDLAAFAGVGRSVPSLGAAMVLFLLSLVGIPPLAGFAGKLLLFGAAIDAHLAWLAVIAILNSVVSLAAYLRIIVPMYQPGGWDGIATRRPALTFVGVASALLTLVVGLGAHFITVSAR